MLLQTDLVRAYILQQKGYDAAVRRSQWGNSDGAKYAAFRQYLAAKERAAHNPQPSGNRGGSTSSASPKLPAQPKSTSRAGDAPSRPDNAHSGGDGEESADDVAPPQPRASIPHGLQDTTGPVRPYVRVDSGQFTCSLPEEPAHVTVLRICTMRPDLFGVGTNKGVVAVYNMLGKTFHKTKGHKRAVTDLHWSSAGVEILVSVAQDGSFIWWNITTGEIQRKLFLSNYSVNGIRVNPVNPNMVYACSADGWLQLLNCSTGQNITSAEKMRVELTALEVDSTGVVLFVGDGNATVYSFVCNMATRTIKEVDRHRPFRRATAVTGITFVAAAAPAEEPKLLVACTRGNVRIYGLKLPYWKLLPKQALQLGQGANALRVLPVLERMTREGGHHSATPTRFLITGDQEGAVLFHDPALPAGSKHVGALQAGAHAVIDLDITVEGEMLVLAMMDEVQLYRRYAQ